MDGFEATRLIRSSQPLYIVAVTANAFATETEKCLGAGMDCVITKPIKVKDLDGIINTAVEHAKRRWIRITTTCNK